MTKLHKHIKRLKDLIESNEYYHGGSEELVKELEIKMADMKNQIDYQVVKTAEYKLDNEKIKRDLAFWKRVNVEVNKGSLIINPRHGGEEEEEQDDE